MRRILIAVIGLILLVVPSPASADGRVIAIIGEDYQPFDVTVEVGDTVTWVNEGGAAHNVRSVDGLFASATLYNGLAYSFTFGQPGTFDYRCGIHPFMKGTVRVSGAASTATAVPQPPAPTAPVAPPAPTPTVLPNPTVPLPTSPPVSADPSQTQQAALLATATAPATSPTAAPTTSPTPIIANTTSPRPAAMTSPTPAVTTPGSVPLPPSAGDNMEGSGPSTTTIFGTTIVVVGVLAGAWWLARGWWR